MGVRYVQIRIFAHFVEEGITLMLQISVNCVSLVVVLAIQMETVLLVTLGTMFLVLIVSHVKLIFKDALYVHLLLIVFSV